MAAALLRRLELGASPSRCRASFAPRLAATLGVADEPLVLDPRSAPDALIVGSAVLRPARGELDRKIVAARGADAFASELEWCHEVEGLPAGAVLSAGSRLDAVRLAMHYGLADAILVGSATVAAEGLPREGRPGWRWRAETPLAFPVLADVREQLGGALRETRRHWQTQGFLSGRDRPALVVVTRARSPEMPAWLRAPALREGECYVLTSRAGAERLSAWRRAGAEGAPPEDMLLPASPPGQPEEIDVAAVPRLLRERLGVRMAGHDGGRRTLAAFSRAGALHQANLTFVGRPSLASAHPGRRGVPFFESAENRLAAVPLLALLGAEEDAWVAQFDTRAGALP